MFNYLISIGTDDETSLRVIHLPPKFWRPSRRRVLHMLNRNTALLSTLPQDTSLQVYVLRLAHRETITPTGSNGFAIVVKNGTAALATE